jgi:hypothetical protein
LVDVDICCLIPRTRLPNLSAALLRDDREQKTNDLGHKAESMLDDLVPKNESSFVIPVAAFPG